MTNTTAIFAFIISTLLACAAHADAPKPTVMHVKTTKSVGDKGTAKVVCQVVTNTLTVCTKN